MAPAIGVRTLASGQSCGEQSLFAVRAKQSQQRVLHRVGDVERVSLTADVVISPEPLRSLAPLYRTRRDDVVTQYDMNGLAAVSPLASRTSRL